MNTKFEPARRRTVALTEHADSARPKPVAERDRGLLSWAEIPEWQKPDLSYVKSGYRTATPSCAQCISSWLYLHNETVNIFSHLFGAALFFALPFILYNELDQRYSTSPLDDIAVMSIYLLGVAACFASSALFHTLISHSAEGFAFGRQLDFQGIIVLMWSASVPMIYYTFYMERRLQRVYWSLTTCFAALASITIFLPAFRRRSDKGVRLSIFGSLALSTLGCVIHGLIAHGWACQSHRFPMSAIAITLLFNSVGSVVYVLRFPERWWPLRFDIFGASHQLMHCAIIIASLVWVVAMVTAFDHAHADLSPSGEDG